MAPGTISKMILGCRLSSSSVLLSFISIVFKSEENRFQLAEEESELTVK